MRFARGTSSLLSLIGLIAISSLAHAAKPIPAPEPLPTHVAHSGVAGEAAVADPACRLGQVGPGVLSLNFLFPPDEYYTLLTPAACAACSSANVIRLSKVHVMLHFVVPSTMPVSISIVGATGPGDCPTPDVAAVLCGRDDFVLVATEPLTTLDTTFTLSAPCEISGNAFLRVSFPAEGTGYDPATRPRIVLAGGCTDCLSYNDFDYDDIPNDMCTPDHIGNPVMYAELDSCFDNVPPSAVTDLAADSVSASAVRLAWTAPGDDGAVGQAISYDLRRATFPLDADNFASGDSLTGVPAPAPAGTRQSHLATGLDDRRLYYFAIRALDEEGNAGPISNVVSVTTGARPGTIVDLAAVGVTEGSVTLQWTAPTGTDEIPPPEFYVVRASTQPLDRDSFDGVPLARVMPSVAAPGAVETYTFDGLEPGRLYWFGVKARDRQGNLSPLSNVVTRWTLVGGPLTGQRGAALSARTTPTHEPVQLYWQSASEHVAAEQVIRIYDMSGRWVQSCYLGTKFGGVALWDGRNYMGQDVPPGLYFARLISGGVRVDARIILVH